MDSTETPAEVIAGDVALAAWQNLLRPGSRLPGPAGLAGSYRMPPATARAALERLERAGLACAGEDGYTVGTGAGDPVRSRLLHVMAAARLCSRLSRPGLDLVDEAREILLRAVRGNQADLGDTLLSHVTEALQDGITKPRGAITGDDPLMKALSAMSPKDCAGPAPVTAAFPGRPEARRQAAGPAPRHPEPGAASAFRYKGP